MRYIKLIFITSFLLAMVACSSGVKFPVSSKIPTADIFLKIKSLESGNHDIMIKAVYLAAPERLSPSRNVYVVWGVTSSDGIRNLGIIDNENGETVKFETMTPFALTEIFITAENVGNITKPEGEEVARIDVKGLKE